MEKSLGTYSPPAAWACAAEPKQGEEVGGLEGRSGIPLPGLRELDPWPKRHWLSGAPEPLVHGRAQGIPSFWTSGHQLKTPSTFQAPFQSRVWMEHRRGQSTCCLWGDLGGGFRTR